MIKLLLIVAAFGALIAGGFGVAQALSPDDTVATQTFTFTNTGVVTYTIPTVTETVTTTVTQPPPPPPPPPVCTNTLSPGGNVTTFESSLSAGQTGCLHGGVYSGQWTFAKSGVAGSPITVQSYPGETAILDANGGGAGLTFNADYVNAKNLLLRNAGTAGGTVVYFLAAADHDSLTQSEIGPTTSQGVFSEAGSNHLTIDRNYCHDIGRDPTRQTHCFYMEGSDNQITNNLIVNLINGFGAQVYPVCARVTIANNTIVGAVLGGVVVGRESGTCDNVDVVNNVVVNSPGTAFVQCYKNPTNVRVHHNLFFNAAATNCAGASNNTNADPLFANGYHLGNGSPGIDTGDNTFLFSPDLDGVVRPQGAGVDKGGYER